MKKWALISFLSFSLAACDSAVKDFVDVAPEAPVVPVVPIAGTNMVKFSPGELTGASASLGIKANITPTNVRMTSAGLGMTVGISKITKQ